jgi:diadenosine hexaphosphate hydrolase (ATP-forming)
MVQRIATSAGAIILREIEGELKIALAQHRRSSKIWALPKGHVDAGESLEQAALREIYEETGLLNVQLITYLGSFARESVKSNGDVEQKTIHFYLAYASGSETSSAPSDPSFIEVGWFSPEQALELIPNADDQAFLKEQLSLMFK